ncbi:MAG: hypothetical protein HYW57_02385 [Ignavibacteriales bacterium]|nr:hypothetical protein [Ignavibacteriales bacterium]
MKYRFLPLLILVAVSLLAVPSCKKSTTEPEKVQVTGDLYPLTTGNKISFNGYIRDAVTDVNIEATASFYLARMTLISPFPPLPSIVAPLAGTTFFIQDSSYVILPGQTTPSWYSSGFYVKRTSATSGDIYFLTNAGRFYRQTGVARTDSLKWVLLLQENAFIGESWVAFDSTYTSASPAIGTARLKVDCVFEGKESVTVNSQTFEAYKLVATRSVYLGGSTTPAAQGATATIWLVTGSGIVKFIFNSDGETPGFERNFLSREGF